MTPEIPEHRRASVARVRARMERASSVVLTTHLNADGDGCGSEVALASWLRERGVDAWIVNPTPYPELFRYLGADPSWIADAGSERASALCAGADLAVIVDTGEVPRIGRVKPMIEGLDTVVIDHHQPGPHPIEGLEIRDPDASATGELIYDLFVESDGPWTPLAIDGMYVAIMTDTGSFRFSNSTPAVHRVVSDLIARGADPERHYRRVYGTSSVNRLRLLRASLGTLEVDATGRVASMEVPRDVFDTLGATPDDLEGIVDYPRTVEGVEVGILLRVTDGGGVKVSLRSNGDVDVNAVARHFGGGGHIKAAGALLNGAMDAVRDEVVRATVEAVDRTLGVGAGEPNSERM